MAWAGEPLIDEKLWYLTETDSGDWQDAMALAGTKRKRSTGAYNKRARRNTQSGGYYGGYNRGGASELKFKDNFSANTAQTGGHVVETFPVIAQGTGESQRLGRQITCEALHINGIITLPASATGSTDVVRIIIVHDKQANGATFSPSDLLEPGTGSADFLSYRNLENTERFRVLSDKRYTMNASSYSSNSTAPNNPQSVPHTRFFNMNFDLKGMKIDYSGTDGTITEIKSNNLLMFYISENGLSVVNTRSRLRFRG